MPLINRPIDSSRYGCGKLSCFCNAYVGRPPAKAGYYPVDANCILYHAYWDGTALDHSQYGNHGTVYGAAFVENALRYDGTDDYVSIPSVNLGTAHTYHVWIKMDTTKAEQILCNEDSTDYLANAGPNVLMYYMADSTYDVIGVVSMYDQWLLASVIRDGNDVAKLYINGVFRGNGDVAMAGNVNFTNIGGRPGIAPYFFDGDLGEVQLHTIAQSPTEILDYYNGTKLRYGL